MPQLDYDYEQAYSYKSSGRSGHARYSSDYNYSENVRRTSDKTKSQVFMLMNDNLAYKPRYKSISEYDIPQEVRNKSYYAEIERNREKNDDLDLIFKPKSPTFDYNAEISSKKISNSKEKVEEVELEDVVSEEEERKEIRRGERKKVFKVIKTSFLCLVGFAVAFFICYRYSMINEKFNQVEKSKKELANIQTVNEQIQADIDSETDLSYIENYARYQLGMQKPQDSQTIYVNTQKQDKVFKPVKIYDEMAEKSDFEAFIEKIASIF